MKDRKVFGFAVPSVFLVVAVILPMLENPASKAVAQQVTTAQITPSNVEKGSDKNPVKGDGKENSDPVPIFDPTALDSPAGNKAESQGTVVLAIVVSTEGKVSDARVIKSDVGLGLDEEALKHVKTWKFKPKMVNGKPVAVLMRVEVNYHLHSPPALKIRLPQSYIPPQLLSGPAPKYPKQARQAKLEGRIVLEITVDKKGHVTDVTEVGPKLGMGLDEMAVKAVRKWKYSPATRDGQPEETRMKVGVSFHL